MLLHSALSNHISYYISCLGMNYSNVAGFLLATTFPLQLLTGLLLCCYYTDYCSVAFDSVVYTVADVNVGWFVRSLHVAGVSLFMSFVFAHFVRGCWVKLRLVCLHSAVNYVWFTGVLLFVLSLVEGFLGYILV